MENFGENYREGKDHILCPLCDSHLDNQALSVQCRVIKSEIDVKEDIGDIFKEDISLETIETVTKISHLRKKLLNTEY